MKNPLRFVLLAAIAFALFAPVLPGLLHAQDASPAPTTEAVTPAVQPSADLPAVLIDLLTKHAWASTVLSVFGILSVFYNALIAWAHQRAAATAELDDDKWIASLETKWWFRVLDRVFYWGGYLGAKLGGRKL